MGGFLISWNLELGLVALLTVRFASRSGTRPNGRVSANGRNCKDLGIGNLEL